MAKIGETGRLISSEKVDGTSVVNPQGEDLGHISELMIDKISGQVIYAVLKYGSFLGVGGELFAVPWDILKYDTGHEAYVINLPEDRLKAAPSYGEANPPDFSDVNWGRQVHDYYDSKAGWYAA